MRPRSRTGPRGSVEEGAPRALYVFGWFLPARRRRATTPLSGVFRRVLLQCHPHEVWDPCGCSEAPLYAAQAVVLYIQNQTDQDLNGNECLQLQLKYRKSKSRRHDRDRTIPKITPWVTEIVKPRSEFPSFSSDDSFTSTNLLELGNTSWENDFSCCRLWQTTIFLLCGTESKLQECFCGMEELE